MTHNFFRINLKFNSCLLQSGQTPPPLFMTMSPHAASHIFWCPDYLLRMAYSVYLVYVAGPEYANHLSSSLN